MAEVVERIVSHLLISVSGVALATLFGVLMGILLTRFRAAALPVIAGIEVLQTVPSLAMLSLLMLFFGLGNVTAVMAIFLYSMLPIVRNTYTGIVSVDPALLEAGRGMGMNNFQLLAKVEIPSAMPVILSGVRISLITAYGIVTIAVLVGGGGLGKFVYRGTQTANIAMILEGAVPICAMAIGTDLWLNKLEKRLARHRSRTVDRT